MSELNTVTLSELAVVDSVQETDKVLIESGGRMKRASGDLLGGMQFCVIDMTLPEYANKGGVRE